MSTPTPRQLECFAAYVRTGSYAAGAHERGIAPQTFKNHLSGLYERLGISGAMEAAARLGWMRIPSDSTRAACGWVGVCSRPLGHRGHHGGMRDQLAIVPREVRLPEEAA